jgi:hypothetical protein
MSVQDKWYTLEDAAAALVNKARLRGGTGDTEQEWVFLLAAARDLALEAFDVGVEAGDYHKIMPRPHVTEKRAEIEALK